MDFYRKHILHRQNLQHAAYVGLFIAIKYWSGECGDEEIPKSSSITKGYFNWFPTLNSCVCRLNGVPITIQTLRII